MIRRMRQAAPPEATTPISPRRGTVVARASAGPLVLALLLAAAWVAPPLAIIVTWPLLFVVPGWTLIAIARPRISAAGRLGLSIVLSMAVSAHLCYWLSLALGGYGRESVFMVAAIMGLPAAVLAARAGGKLLSESLRGSIRALRRDVAAFALAGVAAGFVGLTLAAGIWNVTEAGVTSGGTNWSDLGVHLSIAQSVNAGNFPPQVPYFAGAPLVYHWFSDFHAAMLAEAAGLFAIPAFVCSSAILAGALALIVHGLARQLLGAERRRRRAALLAAVLVVFAGGLGYVRFIADLAAGTTDPLTLISTTGYDNQWLTGWPYFRIPSVMGTGLLPHRATTAGLPILVGAILLLAAGLPTRRARAAGWRDRPMAIGLAGLLGALLAPFHFFYFPAFLLLALAYVLASGRLFDATAPRNAALLLGPYLLAVPFAVAPLLQATGSSALKWVAGWESAPLADGPAAVVFFYLTNLGLPFLLAVIALLFARLHRRAFLGIWVVSLFVVPNVIQVSVVAFDMNKYFQAMWVAVAILAAWLIRRWPAPAIAAVLLVSVPSPLLVAGWTALNRQQVLTHDELDAAAWVAVNTPGQSVFVTDGWLNALTDPAGRLRLLTYTPYIANLGFDADQRVQQVHDIYCAGDAARSAAIMRELHADYLVDAARPQPCPSPTDFASSDSFARIYANPSVRIYRLAQPSAASL
jgi:hypothetical protein